MNEENYISDNRPVTLVPIVPKKSRVTTEARLQVSVRLPTRLVCWAKESIDLQDSFEAYLETALSELGVDYSKPHDSEFWRQCNTKPNNLPMTWGEARHLQLVNEHDETLELTPETRIQFLRAGLLDAAGALFPLSPPGRIELQARKPKPRAVAL